MQRPIIVLGIILFNFIDKSTEVCVSLNKSGLEVCRSSVSGDCRSLQLKISKNKSHDNNLHCRHGRMFLKHFDKDYNKSDHYEEKVYTFRKIWMPFVIVLAPIAILGNALTITISVFELYRKFRVMTKVLKIHTVMVLNLSMADFLMGVYLVTLIKRLSNEKCSSRRCQTPEFIHNCSIVGVITLVSSQVSVTTLVTITTCRLYSVRWPFRNIHLRPIIISLALSWVIWLFIACIPLIDNEIIYNTFHLSMFVRGSGCSHQPNEKEYCKWETFLKKLLNPVNCTHLLPQTRSWNGLKKIFSDIRMFNYSDLWTIGYYEQMPTCSINFIVASQDTSMPFLLFLVTFNLIAFVYIAFAYCYIYRKTDYMTVGCTCKKSCDENSNQDRRERENHAMHRRMFFIVFTDFACWIPMSLIVILRAIDQEIFKFDEDAVVFMSIVLFPLNSILNPLLYTATWCKLFKKLCKCKFCHIGSNIELGGDRPEELELQ